MRASNEPRATWHAQRLEYAAMFAPNTAQFGFTPELYASMRDNALNLLDGDYDVFGDGSVVIHATPGINRCSCGFPNAVP